MPNPPQARERVDVEGLRQLLAEVTAGDLSTAEDASGAEWLDCPACGGDGRVEGVTYTNFDGIALGVQFFGIGKEFGAHQRLWEAALTALPALLDQSAEIASLKAAVEVARGALEAADSASGRITSGSPGPLYDMGFSAGVQHIKALLKPALAKLSALNAATLSGETGNE